MSEPSPAQDVSPQNNTASSAAGGSSKIPAADNAERSTEVEPAPSTTPSPEEQMALYEKELKENDWGHQPC